MEQLRLLFFGSLLQRHGAQSEEQVRELARTSVRFANVAAVELDAELAELYDREPVPLTPPPEPKVKDDGASTRPKK